MKNLLKEMIQREQNLAKIKQNIEKSMVAVPKGSLYISMNEGKPRYYHGFGRKNRRYLGNDEIEFVKKLAQKYYNKKVLKAIDQELKSIRLFLAGYPEVEAEGVYDSLTLEQQALIRPFYETDEQFIERWMAIACESKGFRDGDPELYTARGERVRSKSEIMIANVLDKVGLPYKYECPLELNEITSGSNASSISIIASGLNISAGLNKSAVQNISAGLSVSSSSKMTARKDAVIEKHKISGNSAVIRKIYPDFTVLNLRTRQELYWEHFGMMDDAQYADTAIKKIGQYEQNGIMLGEKLIATFETRSTPLDEQKILATIKNVLM